MYLKKTENSDKREEKTVYVNIALVMPDKRQPRKKFDEVALAELAGSIKQYGIISPIIVRENDGFYQIIAGERRWRAARLAGLKEVPIIVRDYEEQVATEISILENIQREDLNPIEEAMANKRLMERSKTLHEYMLFVGKMREYVSVFGKDEGVKFAIDDCIKNGILSSFLLEKKAEVIMIGVYEYDEEKHMRIVARDAKAEGLEEGREEGREEAILQVKTKLIKALSRMGEIPNAVMECVEQANELDVLMDWLILASTSETFDEFEEKIK